MKKKKVTACLSDGNEKYEGYPIVLSSSTRLPLNIADPSKSVDIWTFVDE